jgi:hypothetical protein
MAHDKTERHVMFAAIFMLMFFLASRSLSPRLCELVSVQTA